MKRGPSWSSSQARLPVGVAAAARRAAARRAGRRRRTARCPGWRAACRRSAGVDRRPELTRVRANGVSAASESAASRMVREALRLGRDEVGRAGGVEQVLVGRGLALQAVGGEQRRRGLPLQHGRELPGEVVGVLHAAVEAAGAEGRDQVRGVAGEDHRAVDEALQAPALEGVDADPLELERPVLAEHRLQARADALGLALLDRVGVPAELEVDAPDVVGLLVQQGRLAGVERRVEPEPALGRVVGRHLDVGDQEPVLEHPALEREAHELADLGARAVAGDQPVGLDRVGAVGRLQIDAGMIGEGLDADALVLEAQVDARQLLARS